MKNTTFLPLLTPALILGAQPAPATQQWSAEVSYLHRSATGSDLSRRDVAGLPVVLAGEDARPGWRPSLALEYSLHLNEDIRLTAGARYLGSWRGDKRVFDPDEEIEPVRPLQDDQDDWTSAIAHKIEYSSRLWGLELTLNKRLKSAEMEAFCGLTYLDLSEDFDWHTQDNADSVPGDNGYATYGIDTENRMLGLVVGLSAAHAFDNQARLFGKIKLGALANRMRQHSYLQNDLNASPDLGAGSKRRTDLSGLLEGRIGIELAPKKDLRVDAGYQAMYVTDVALAPDQVTFGEEEAGPALDARLSRLDTGNMLLHGPFLNLRMALD